MEIKLEMKKKNKAEMGFMLIKMYIPFLVNRRKFCSVTAEVSMFFSICRTSYSFQLKRVLTRPTFNLKISFWMKNSQECEGKFLPLNRSCIL